MGGALNSQLERAGVAFAPLSAAQAAQALDHGVSPMKVDTHDTVAAHEGLAPLPDRCLDGTVGSGRADLHAVAMFCINIISTTARPVGLLGIYSCSAAVACCAVFQSTA
jgi:hypothetical protein